MDEIPDKVPQKEEQKDELPVEEEEEKEDLRISMVRKASLASLIKLVLTYGTLSDPEQ